MSIQPAWTLAALAFVAHCNTHGIRIKALHLTPAQARDLKRYTSQQDYLLGYPVKVTPAYPPAIVKPCGASRVGQTRAE